MGSNDREELISARQAAAILGCGIRTTQRLAQRGELKVFKLAGPNGQYVFRRKEVERYRAKLEQKFAQEYE